MTVDEEGPGQAGTGEGSGVSPWFPPGVPVAVPALLPVPTLCDKLPNEQR